jgi:hypothetical protein
MSEFTYQPQYGIIVVCEDERHQQELYDKLSRMGLKTKVVCV